MAHKRNAQEAFGQPQEQLSAFAAAKLGKQLTYSFAVHSSEPESALNGNTLAVETANTPYDGIHSRTSTPEIPSPENDLTVLPSSSSAKITFSTFVSGVSNVIRDDEQCIELILKRHETLALVGEYDLEVLESPGTISIAGFIPQPKHGQFRIYAPSTHPLPQIRAIRDDATVRISSTTSGVRKLEKLSPLFRNIWNSGSSNDRSFALLGSSNDDTIQRALSLLHIDTEMDAVLRAISPKSIVVPKPRIMCLGAKSSGKSTFNRVLCNCIYTWSQRRKFLYLDLDPGQPEFGPPGQISLVEVIAPLLGPPLTHPASSMSKNFRLIRSHTIAATHFKDDPEHYKACVADLVQHAGQDLPLIANSCGWVSGLGATILVELVCMLMISDAVILEPLEDSLIESLRNASPNTVLHRISRRAPKPASRTPAEARAMQTMAYFHHRTDSVTGELIWSRKAIDRIRSWIVNYADPNPGIHAIISYGQTPPLQFLAEVLDGSVVAIVVLEGDGSSPMFFDRNETGPSPETHSTDLKEMVVWTPEDLPSIAPNALGTNHTLNPSTSHCVGTALIRGIDTKRKELHLVAPLLEREITQLENKRVVLVRGNFDPPEWAYLEDLFKSGDRSVSDFDDEIRPWVSEKGSTGIEASVWRMRHPPLSSVTPMNG